MEADGAESRKDFQHKVTVTKKEAKETMHWLRMLAIANPLAKDECRKLWQEAHELTLIFSAIIRSKGKPVWHLAFVICHFCFGSA